MINDNSVVIDMKSPKNTIVISLNIAVISSRRSATTSTNSLPICAVKSEQHIIASTRSRVKRKSCRSQKISRKRKTVTTEHILAHRKHCGSSSYRNTCQCRTGHISGEHHLEHRVRRKRKNRGRRKRNANVVKGCRHHTRKIWQGLIRLRKSPSSIRTLNHIRSRKRIEKIVSIGISSERVWYSICQSRI